MKKAKLVVHPNYAKAISIERNTDKSKIIYKNIEEALRSKNSYIIKVGCDPREVPDLLKGYDFVEVYGALHGYCLTATDLKLTLMNIDHNYSKNGYF